MKIKDKSDANSKKNKYEIVFESADEFNSFADSFSELLRREYPDTVQLYSREAMAHATPPQFKNFVTMRARTAMSDEQVDDLFGELDSDLVVWTIKKKT